MNRNRAADYALELIRLGVLSIDAEGRIWRHKRMARGTWRAQPAVRAENPSQKGYLRLNLQLPETKRLGCVAAHIVVFEHFKGPVPEGLQINHINLIKNDNHPDNLEAVTGAENIQHSYANGRPMPWYKATVYRGRPRIDAEKMAAIRADRKAGKLLKEIREAHGVSLSHIHRICAEKGGEQ